MRCEVRTLSSRTTGLLLIRNDWPALRRGKILLTLVGDDAAACRAPSSSALPSVCPLKPWWCDAEASGELRPSGLWAACLEKACRRGAEKGGMDWNWAWKFGKGKLVHCAATKSAGVSVGKRLASDCGSCQILDCKEPLHEDIHELLITISLSEFKPC